MNEFTCSLVFMPARMCIAAVKKYKAGTIFMHSAQDWSNGTLAEYGCSKM